MTAKEKEICDQSILYFKKVQKPKDNPLEVCAHFITGAKWADKVLIKKACKWLENYSELTGVDYETIKESFLKAMEE